ncbi:MAG: hypothetical protein ACYTGZ_19340 [Planctomycetota bacterium]|jgi:hypothetical protein
MKKKFVRSLRGIDGLLRGESTLHFGGLVRAIFVLGGFYGVSMGLFAALRGSHGTGWQMPASALKIPLLFLLTLLVTFPSLYVFSALSRSTMEVRASLHLLIRAITVSIALLASFGPITAFFTLSTSSYPFMVLLNVAFFAVAGVAGMKYLGAALESMFDSVASESRARDASQDHASRILRNWIYIYGAVGAQMAWILRPFVGTPELPFTLFRQRESNFFMGVMDSIRLLFQ